MKVIIVNTARGDRSMMKIALITGASSGLGREFARQIPKLYQNLDEIWVVARRAERLNELEMELKVPVRIFDGDLNQDYIYKKLGIALGKSHANVRMLVNAAGYGKIGTFCEYGWKEETGMVDLNCRSLTRMTALCLPYMHCGSRIVNLSSAAAFGPQPGFAVYAATKSYVYSLSMALGRELKGSGIYVTAVCPGPVDTEFFDHTGKEVASVKKKFRADAKDVVRKALIDSARGKKISVYGLSMKAAWVASKVVPDSVIVAVMEKIAE